MARRGMALWGVLAVVAILFAAALWEAPRVESGLTLRTEQLLAERGVTGVEIRFDGRDAVLAGPGVSADVVALVAGQPGVRRVRVVPGAQRTAASSEPVLGASPAVPSAGPPAGSSSAPSPGPAAGSGPGPASRVARQIVELLGPDGLRFDPGSAALTAAQQPVLDQVAALLVANPTVRLLVSGYTDLPAPGGGSPLALSRQRAVAVADYLLAHRVAAAVLTVEAYGDTRPVAGNDTAAGRAANRRVEITVLGG
jgi:outer membrane protein OmpA-like peptidoglycan-associated protein